MSYRDSGSDSAESSRSEVFDHESQDLSIESDKTSSGRQRKSRRPPKGFGGYSSSAPVWQHYVPFLGGGNPLSFPINAQQPSNHWAYPSYPPAPQAIPGGPLIMPPWCSYYPGSTMNADPSVMFNRPTSAVSGPLTGPAISGPFTGPAPSGSSTPAPAGSTLLTGQASLSRQALNLSEASKLYHPGIDYE